jgi:hypothetical protein
VTLSKCFKHLNAVVSPMLAVLVQSRMQLGHVTVCVSLIDDVHAEPGIITRQLVNSDNGAKLGCMGCGTVSCLSILRSWPAFVSVPCRQA